MDKDIKLKISAVADANLAKPFDDLAKATQAATKAEQVSVHGPRVTSP
jgi:hypothetical protein